ncbi:MAG: bifunctional oligoribonuclease/PAP phosphatase NrnA, partial [Desulfitobacterium sp.]|nr:bifunctional oligoribonuclease/PAP phosphatase NrnA [Desulfitobacterium sp.]
LGIGLALEAMGKEVSMFNPDPIPYNLQFLPGVKKIQPTISEPLPETVLFVDCTDLQRVQLTETDFPQGITILNVDHHVSNENFGHLNWVDPQASATGELVYELLQILGVPLEEDIATNIYTAILTDTGSFKYSNTTAKTHKIAGELISSGLDLGHIHHQVFDQTPLAKLELLRRALNQLEIIAQGQGAIITLSTLDFQKSGALDSHSEGIIEHGRTLEGVEVAALLKETNDGKVRVSLRSNQWCDVNKIAAHFGGGGHQRAAGCTLNLSLDDARKLVIGKIEEALNLGRNN